MKPVLSIRHLQASYGQAQVLHDIHLDVSQGECLALLGRNGAGKTSLLHCLFNIGPQWQGSIQIDQQDINGLAAHRIARQGIALVPQGRGVFPTLTVEESLKLASLIKRKQAATAISLANIYADMPRLHERRHQSCSALSGGERQLLAVARALLTQSRIIVLDEPSEGLAPMTIDQVLRPQLASLRDKGYTLILAEQNAPLALGLASRAVVLHNGTTVFDGTPASWSAQTTLQQQYLGIGA